MFEQIVEESSATIRQVRDSSIPESFHNLNHRLRWAVDQMRFTAPLLSFCTALQFSEHE